MRPEHLAYYFGVQKVKEANRIDFEFRSMRREDGRFERVRSRIAEAAGIQAAADLKRKKILEAELEAMIE